jgi:hypothetical protein
MAQSDDHGGEELPDLTETEREALHSVELGLEWLRRAHGDLIGVHHKVGHAMDHFDRAEAQLRECGQPALADRLRDDCLPRGAIGDRWTYDLLEDFEAGMLADIVAFEERARERVADGQRHVAERHQERAWRGRARDDRE